MKLNLNLEKINNFKSFLINIGIITLFIVLPNLIIEVYTNKHGNNLLRPLQYLTCFIFIAGSIILIKINNKLLRLSNIKKWPLYCFNVLGAVLIALSSIFALAIYFFRNVGF
ncbi:MAG: hypothetical protein WC621_01450 [Patescibacteria group bacterium]